MQTHLRNALLISSVFLVIALNFPTVQSASILDEIKGSSNSIVKMVQSLCLTSENCNREFFNLDNYCCNTGHCCNIVKYVLENDDKIWTNFKYTCENPRLINLIMFVVLVLVLCAVVSILMSILGYFCCGCSKICCCCGQRKYTIVSH